MADALEQLFSRAALLDCKRSSMTDSHESCSTSREVPVIDQDGNEGDDERTSELSGSELGTSAQKESQQVAEASEEVLKNHSPMTDKGSVEQQRTQQRTSLDDREVEAIKPVSIRKKHRRGSKRNRRKYKPYSKLSWEEKKAKDERDSVRANKMREKYMNEKGRPTAPYNTTQFLMAEHDLKEPDLGSHSHKGENKPRLRSDSCSMDDSDFDEYNESPDDEIYEQEFFKKDFTEAYEQVHAENLHSMSKSELVHEFMHLEERVEDMEKRLREKEGLENGLINNTSPPELGLKLSHHNSTTPDVEEDGVEELRRLQVENERLAQENTELKKAQIAKLDVNNTN